MGRYDRNGILSAQEQETLKGARVCVVGCGGLGGYVLEMLARIGVGHLTAIDGDVFESSNLNRQILSLTDNLGEPKSLVAASRLKAIQPEMVVEAHQTMLSEENVHDLIKNHHVVIDALDNIKTRLLLESACKALNIPLVHGAIAGWYGQVVTVLPGDDTLSHIYKNAPAKGVEKVTGNPAFTPAFVASLQVSECIKLIIGRGHLLSHQMLVVNLLDNDYDVVPLIIE